MGDNFAEIIELLLNCVLLYLQKILTKWPTWFLVKPPLTIGLINSLQEIWHEGSEDADPVLLRFLVNSHHIVILSDLSFRLINIIPVMRVFSKDHNRLSTEG